MAARIAASATVRAVKGRKLIPTRAALTLVGVPLYWNLFSMKNINHLNPYLTHIHMLHIAIA